MGATWYAPTVRSSLLAGMFGTGHAAWAPTTFTAILGDSQTGGAPAPGPATNLYSASATIPNDGTHWIPSGTGYTNAQFVTFSPLTSGDIAVWDNHGLSVTLEDGAGHQIANMAYYSPLFYLFYPFVGLEIGIGPGILRFL